MSYFALELTACYSTLLSFLVWLSEANCSGLFEYWMMTLIAACILQDLMRNESNWNGLHIWLWVMQAHICWGEKSVLVDCYSKAFRRFSLRHSVAEAYMYLPSILFDFCSAECVHFLVCFQDSCKRMWSSQDTVSLKGYVCNLSMTG